MALTGTGVLVSQQLANTETTQYTAPSTVSGNPLKAVTVKSASLTNTSGSPIPVSVSVLKSGQTVDGTHRVISAYPLAGGDSAVLPELAGVFLGPGDFISAIASAVVQTVTVTGGAGTFTLTVLGQTTGAIAYNATAVTVQNSVQALSTVGGGNVTVTGSAGGPYTVTLSLGNTIIPLMAGAGSGGASVAIASASVVDFVLSGVVLS